MTEKKQNTVLEVLLKNQRRYNLSSQELSSLLESSHSSAKCDSKTVKSINWYELYNLNLGNKYWLTIIQDSKIILDSSDVLACYQLDPFKSAIVLARNAESTQNNVTKIFRFIPTPFKGTIYLHDFCELEPNFKLYDVFTKNEDGTLVPVKDFEELHAKSQIIAISKSNPAIPNFTFTLLYCPDHF